MDGLYIINGPKLEYSCVTLCIAGEHGLSGAHRLPLLLVSPSARHALLGKTRIAARRPETLMLLPILMTLTAIIFYFIKVLMIAVILSMVVWWCV